MADQRLLEAGRTAAIVGRASPRISFLTFDGTQIELHNRTRPVVVMLFDAPCTDCDQELSKAAVLATVLADDAWVAVLSGPSAAAVIRSGVAEAGAGELLFAGEDKARSIARSFEIERPLATVVLDAKARIAGVWQTSVPAAVVMQLVRDGSGG